MVGNAGDETLTLLRQLVDRLTVLEDRLGDKVWYSTDEVGRMMKPPRSGTTVALNCLKGRIKGVKSGPLQQDPWRIHKDEVKRLLCDGYLPLVQSPQPIGSGK